MSVLSLALVIVKTESYTQGEVFGFFLAGTGEERAVTEDALSPKKNVPNAKKKIYVFQAEGM